MWVRARLAAALLAAGAFLVSPAGAAATFPGGNGRIAYSVDVEGQHEISPTG